MTEVWGRSASKEAIAALLVWRPKDPERTGFGLKWHAVFAAGRATEVLGLHPVVREELAVMLDELADLHKHTAISLPEGAPPQLIHAPVDELCLRRCKKNLVET